MFVLVLNPMRGRLEECREVARAETREELLAFLARERVGAWTSEEDGGYRGGHTWRHVFRRGSPLEWFNDLDTEDGEPNHHGHGIHAIPSIDDVLQQVRKDYREKFDAIPLVSSFPVCIEGRVE